MVNTFILSNDPKECATKLDPKRLGKQRVEAYQTINIIESNTTKKGFSNHPLVLMWKDYCNGLKYYCNCMIEEWVKQGYKNTMKLYDNVSVKDLPWWYSNKQVQYSNMASLNRKDPSFYEFKYPDEYNDHGYIWINKLNNDQLEKMKKDEFLELKDICSPIGTGAPAQFRVTKEEALNWFSNKNINPKTNRKIKENSSIYNMYNKAYIFYTK
jgi:hypothetical protein